jgi:hypothetical protein
MAFLYSPGPAVGKSAARRANGVVSVAPQALQESTAKVAKLAKPASISALARPLGELGALGGSNDRRCAPEKSVRPRGEAAACQKGKAPQDVPERLPMLAFSLGPSRTFLRSEDLEKACAAHPAAEAGR